MEQFYFNVERRISTWIRELHSISAESKEDAIKQMIVAFKEDELEDTDTFLEQDQLFDLLNFYQIYFFLV